MSGAFAVLALAAAVGAAAAGAQTTRRPATAAAGYGAQTVATVDGERITRDQVFDEMLDTQLTRLNATNPIFRDMRNLSAGQFDVVIAAGRIALRRAASGDRTPVTRLEVMRDVFTRKPQIVVDTLQNMIMERAVAHAAKAAGVSLAAKDVRARMVQFIDQSWRQPYRMVGKTDEQIVSSMGVSRATLQRYMAFLIAVERMAERDIARKIGHPPAAADYADISRIAIVVTPAAVPPAGTGPTPPTTAQAEMDKAFEREKPRILAAIEEVKSGKKTFEQVAGDINTDETKFRQGTVGIVLRGQLEPEVDKVVFALPKGELSAPIRTRTGWHVYRVTRTGVELTGPERATALRAAVEAQRQRIVRESVAKAKTTNTMPPPPAPGMPVQGR